MRPDARLPDHLALPEEAGRGLSPALRDLQTLLLAYKSFFVGEWYTSLIREQDVRDVERVLREISERAIQESLQLVSALQDWETLHADADRVDPVRERLRARLLQDLLNLKENASETVVMAAMAAPTADLRDRILRLADEDRRNGDLIRGLLKTRPVRQQRLDDSGEGGPCGVDADRAAGELVSARVRRALDALTGKGDRPVRLVVSGMAVRHLRDEGVVQAPDGTVFDLPVTVDFAWSGSCFAVLTNESVSLAEIFTSEHTGAPPPDASG